MRRLVALIAATPLLASLMIVLGQGTASASDRDCGDFSTQAAAQSYFISKGGPAIDPDLLDADGDGIACDSLPCPCVGSPDPKPASALRVVRVLSGELIRVRRGDRPSFVVHLMGVDVPNNRCKARVALKDLRSWVRPGMKVRQYRDQASPNRDPRGHLWRYLERVRGGWDIGGSQIDTGFGRVQRGLNFERRSEYVSWAIEARAAEKGYYSRC